MLLVLIILVKANDDKEQVTSLDRPDYGEEESIYELNYEMDGETYEIEIPVAAKTLSGEDMQAAFDEAYEEIVAAMPGDNEDLMHVMSDLNFTENIERYGMSVDYTLDDYSLIDCYGSYCAGDDAFADVGYVELIIYARITYEEFSQTYEIPVCVYPAEKSDSESMQDRIISEISEGEESVELPTVVDGVSVTFWKQKESMVGAIFLLIVAGGLIAVYRKYSLPKKIQEERDHQMRLDYSEIVSKLSLLMGAGMSGMKALKKISTDYLSDREKGKCETRYAYEEIVKAVNRFDTGVSEDICYADFGRSCHIHSYIKLGSLLAQNVRKGGEGFTQILREEVSESFTERKSLARKAGEEAGTKLLIPMIMMLGIVLIMIIVPAFMSF